ncbi:MAG: tRNA (adenosine(37)-N6)-threonylcarbamoyltransferase complex ATPase subunit type 1 TsaE [bacterium]
MKPLTLEKSSEYIWDGAAEQKVVTRSPEETRELGEKFAQFLSAGDVIAFFGELGSGKTTMIKGVCQGLNVCDDVTSPTFTLIQEYRGRLPVYHFDFYRTSSPNEIWELGCDDYFYGDGICLIEWPDRIFAHLPQKRVNVHLQRQFEKGRRNQREILIQKNEINCN